jgi:Raf kinase inhibitor-like YbhB/YbcL family protein
MAKDQLTVSSPAFQPEGAIPAPYTCDGRNINPPLQIGSIPTEAASLALIVEDPDAPSGTFVHWLAWNIEPAPTIAEDSRPGEEGTNDFGDKGYGGPCPPSGTHRYYFRVFALRSRLSLPAGANKKALEQAMAPHVVAEGALIGRYARR